MSRGVEGPHRHLVFIKLKNLIVLQVKNLAAQLRVSSEHLLFKFVSIKFFVDLRLHLLTSFLEDIHHIPEASEMIIMSMSYEYFLDLNMSEIAHELVEVFEEFLIPFRIVPRFDHYSVCSRAYDETIRPTQRELALIFPWNVIDKIP